MTLTYIFLATFIVSLISLVGVFTIVMKKDTFQRILIPLVGFAAGALIGGAFLHLLPEAIDKSPDIRVFVYALVGFVLFFVMERYLHWQHCHEGICEVKSFTYMNLIGDAVHNFTDGIIIAASFMTDVKLGVITTMAVVMHEIPQEIGDFGILMYGGFSRRKALACNFLCALTAFLGAGLGYAIVSVMDKILFLLISFTAGGFIYIAASDLIPELHKHKDPGRANVAFVTFIFGVLFMALTKFFL